MTSLPPYISNFKLYKFPLLSLNALDIPSHGFEWNMNRFLLSTTPYTFIDETVTLFDAFKWFDEVHKYLFHENQGL